MNKIGTHYYTQKATQKYPNMRENEYIALTFELQSIDV